MRTFSPTQFIENNAGLCIALFLIVFSVISFAKAQRIRPFTGDAIQYVRGAYHLAYNGSYSYSRNLTAPEPTIGRAPGYSLFMAGLAKATPWIQEDDLKSLLQSKNTQVESPILTTIKYVQDGLLLCMAFLVAWMVWDRLGRTVPAYATLWLVAFNPFLAWYTGLLYRETLAAFFFTAFSTSLYSALKRNRLPYFALAGSFLGLLTLTMPQWKYVGAASLMAITICMALKRQTLLKGLLGLAALSLVWVATFHPWELRNDRLFGHKGLSIGGGVVLELRSQYDLIAADTYWLSFPYWGGGVVFQDNLTRLVDSKALTPLLRDNPQGCYPLAKKKRAQLIHEYGDKIEADNRLKQKALTRIKKNWGRHLLMVLPMTARSIVHPVFSIVYTPVYLLFIMGAYYSLRDRDWSMLALMSPPMALFCFNVLATHALPRYTAVVTPVFLLGAIMGFFTYRRRMPSRS